MFCLVSAFLLARPGRTATASPFPYPPFARVHHRHLHRTVAVMLMVSVPLPSRTALEPYSGRSAMQAQAVVQGRAAGQGDTPALDLYKYGGGFIY